MYHIRAKEVLPLLDLSGQRPEAAVGTQLELQFVTLETAGGGFYKLGVRLVGVLEKKALVFGVCIRAPVFFKLSSIP